MAECVQGHVVAIHDRGGKRPLWPLRDLSSIEWGRLRSSMSESKLQILGDNCDAQTSTLEKIRAHRHELVIWRDGKRVWEGPIEDVQWDDGFAQIIAKDVSRYGSVTSLSRRWPGPDGGGPPLMTDRVASILSYELNTPYTMIVGTGGAATPVTVTRWEQQSPPANISLDVRSSSTLRTTSSTEAFEMLLGEHLDNLAESGLDYTVVGRRWVFWDSATPLGQTRILTEADFTTVPRVIESGPDHRVIGHVSAQRADDPIAYPNVGVGHAGVVDPYYGPWESIVTSSSEEGEQSPSQDALNSQAQRHVRGANPVPLRIQVPQDAGLVLGPGLKFDHLVPGTVMPVTLKTSLRNISQDQILDAVKVVETGDGETISVTMSPWGGVTA